MWQYLWSATCMCPVLFISKCTEDDCLYVCREAGVQMRGTGNCERLLIQWNTGIGVCVRARAYILTNFLIRTEHRYSLMRIAVLYLFINLFIIFITRLWERNCNIQLTVCVWKTKASTNDRYKISPLTRKRSTNISRLDFMLERFY